MSWSFCGCRRDLPTLDRQDHHLDVADRRRIVGRLNLGEGQVTEIRAPYLELEPDQSRAETDTRVQIRIGSRSLTATGMLASLRDSRVTLKSNVSGKFVP